MKKTHLAKTFLLCCLIYSCQKESRPLEEASATSTDASAMRGAASVMRSEEVAMGNGTVRSFVRMADRKTPLEIGVEMTAGALQNLGQEHHPYLVTLPVEARTSTAFDHVSINWNAMGHPPMMFYGVPHFDFHFFTIPTGKQLSIPAYSPETAHKFDKVPDAGYLPAIYVPTPAGEPQMGKHWIDPTSPEFQPGGTFTSTMIYGTYNGEVVFVEPMITLSYLLNTTSFSRAYPQPQNYSPKNTYYPTRYNIYQQDGKYYVSLSHFVMRR